METFVDRVLGVREGSQKDVAILVRSGSDLGTWLESRD